MSLQRTACLSHVFYFRSSGRLWIFIPNPSMYLPHAPGPINPSADEQHEAGEKNPAATSRYVEGRGQAQCAFPPPSPPDLPVPGAYRSALDTLVPPAHMHTGVPARRCIYRRQREAGGSHSHASRMWFKEQVPTSLTLTVPVLLRGQPDLPLIYSDHRTNGLNKILHDWVTPFLAFIRHAEERWFTLPE